MAAATEPNRERSELSPAPPQRGRAIHKEEEPYNRTEQGAFRAKPHPTSKRLQRGRAIQRPRSASTRQQLRNQSDALW
jgi:hypothetical protein